MRTQKVLIAMNVVLISIILIGWSSGLQKQDFSEIRIKDKNGKTKILMGVDDKGDAVVVMYDKADTPTHILGYGEKGVPYVDVKGESYFERYVLQSRDNYLVAEWRNDYSNPDVPEMAWSHFYSYLPDGSIGLSMMGGFITLGGDEEGGNSLSLTSDGMTLKLKEGDHNSFMANGLLIKKGKRLLYGLEPKNNGLINEIFYDAVGRNRVQVGFDSKNVPSLLLSDEKGNVIKQMY